MRVLDSRAETTTGRLLVVGAFLVVALLTTAAFAQAVTGHVASMRAPSADATVVGYEAGDDRLEVTLRVHNPTTKDYELVSTSARARVDGELVTEGTRTMLDGRVPAGESAAVTVSLDFHEGGAERFRSADPDRREIEGRIKVKIVEEAVLVDIDGSEVTG